MGIMGFLRNRMGLILVVVIGFALFAFIAGEVIHYGSSFFHGDDNEIGKVADSSISYDEFSKLVDFNTRNFQEQSHQTDLTPQITNYIQETTWGQKVNQIVLTIEMDKLGLAVGADEAHSLIQGDNPSQQIIQAFGDPKTGQLDRSKLNDFLSNINGPGADTTMVRRWSAFVTQIVNNKRTEKYLSLVTNALYVNSLEAKDDYDNKNKAVNFKYVKLDYASIPDNKVTVTDDDYENYYDQHKGEFYNPQELRTLSYVSFNAAPSKDDSAAIKDQIVKLIPAFKASANDSLFIEVNSDTKTQLEYQHKGQLGAPLDSVMFNMHVDSVYGPYLSNNHYKIAKLLSVVVGPDSVKAKHILLPVVNGVDKALVTADSLKKLIEAGKSFADLANMYSVDKGSAAKGGELGTFGRGSMVPVFEDAVFNGKKGDLKIVTSQYGVHLIQIEDQIGSSKVVKVAVVDKALVASSATQSAAYSKAQAFLGKVNKDNFNAEAAASGVKVKTAPDVNPTAPGIPGAEDARPVIKWAYKASVGDVSDQVFTIGNQDIVAQLTQVKPMGTLPLEDVKQQIQPLVLNMVKGKILTDKIQAAISSSSNINQVAQKLGTQVVPLQNIVAANPVIPAEGPDYTLVGTIFGSQPGKLSKPVSGVTAVFAFTVDSFINPPPLANAIREKQEIGQALLQRAEQQVVDALKDKANVKDYRVKFL